jgi:hypothetical protein
MKLKVENGKLILVKPIVDDYGNKGTWNMPIETLEELAVLLEPYLDKLKLELQ